MGETDSCSLATRLLGIGWFGGRNDNLRVVLELVEATVGDNISGFNSFYLREPVIGDPNLDVLQMGDVVLNDVHERCLAVLLDRRRRNQSYSFEGFHQQPRIDKLVRKQREIIIVESRAHFHRPRRGVDLVIESQQLATRDFLLRGAIEDVDRQLDVLTKLSLDRAKAVLRNGEDHRNRVYLCDDYEWI
jgi:hypothetical protein